MLHPDGEISLFNDAAHGVAASPSEIDGYAQRLELGRSFSPREGVTSLAALGFIRVQQEDYVALLDVGAIGPDYLPGHAHADTLTFELSVRGKRLLVNSGTSSYQLGHERFYERSTAAHNTVMVDGENSSEVWSAFRVGRRAYPVGLSISESKSEARVQCGHDGYRRLPGKVTHWRHWCFQTNRLTIRDRLDGRFGKAVSHLHVHPDFSVAGHLDRIEPREGQAIRYKIIGGDPLIISDAYHPQFSTSVPSQCIRTSIRQPECLTHLLLQNSP